MLKIHQKATTISQARDSKKESVVIKGWIYRKRSSGGKIFAVIHDHTGILQCVIDRSAIREPEWAGNRKGLP